MILAAVPPSSIVVESPAIAGQHKQLPPSRGRASALSLELSAGSGELEILLRFQATDSGNAPLASLELAKGTTRSVIESMTEADFAKPPPGVEVIALGAGDASYLDRAVSEGVEYSYRLHGCDAGVPASCALSKVVPGTAGPVSLEFFFGGEEMVFDAPPQACATTTGFDIADGPARAVRRSDGSLLLVCGNSRGNFFDEGPDFSALARNCATPAPLDSHFDDDPSHFDFQFWVYATYRDPTTEHPDRVYALIHHEYHDRIHPPCTDPTMTCWYNSIEYAYSDDGGHSYVLPPMPTRLVAALPYPWDPLLTTHPGEIGPFPYGYFPGSNIFKGVDGYYYEYVLTLCNPIQPILNSYMSLMRTADLEDPQSWRFFDGTGFEHQTLNPYVNGVSYETAIADPGRYFAGRLDPNITGVYGSVTYNVYLQKYMILGHYGDGLGGVPCGFYYALSNDLLHWSRTRLCHDGNLATCNETLPQLVYPSIIDRDDPSPNFEFPDDTFDVYFVRYSTNTDRDLVRVPVRIEHP